MLSQRFLFASAKAQPRGGFSFKSIKNCYLGDTQYIVFSTRSFDVMKLCRTKKTTDFPFFFPPTCHKNNDFFNQKMHKQCAICLKKMLFSRCESARKFFYFLRRGGKTPCRTLSTKQYTEYHLVILDTSILYDNRQFFSPPVLMHGGLLCVAFRLSVCDSKIIHWTKNH